MTFPTISSRQNKIIRKAASLSEASARRETGMFLAEGARLCADAAESGIQIDCLFFTGAAADKYDAYLQVLTTYAHEAYIIEDHVAQLLSQTKHTQGVFCQCGIPKLTAGNPRGKCIVLEDMQDPANLGAVMRTAEALGIGQVLLLGARQDPYAPKVLRASMGAVFRQTVSVFEGREEIFQALEQANSVTYAAALEHADLQLGAFAFPENSAVFIGNEGNGLTAETISGCDHVVKIPMRGRAESLNAAAAASILMWEMVRESRPKKS